MAWGLIFPLAPGEKGAYDVNFNLVTLERAQADGHAVIDVVGANGVAVGPRWFLTAAHLVKGAPTNTWVGDGIRSYQIEEVVELDPTVSPDMALVRVNRPFPFYSEIAKRPVLTGEIVEVYGRSAAAREPIFDAEFRPCGWKLAAHDYYPALRRGLARKAFSDPRRIVWRFTDQDPELGLNCAATSTNDSGGGIFLGRTLAGLSFRGGWTNYRTNRLEAANCRMTNTAARGLIYHGATLFRCSSDSAPASESTGTAVYPQLSNIFAHIAPPRLLNIAGPAVASSAGTWEEVNGCSGCGTFDDSAVRPIDTSRVRNPPPEEVYRSIAFLQSQPGAAMTFTINEFIKYERYRVRLHFAGIYPNVAPDHCTQRILVNGKETVVDPFAGIQKASELSFHNIAPDAEGKITVTILPANSFGNATLSAIDVHIVPVWPSAIEGLQWTSERDVFSAGITEVQAIAAQDHNIVAVLGGTNQQPTLAVSTNGGAEFERFELATAVDINALEIAGGRVVAAANDGTILLCTNGVDWMEEKLESGADLYAIAEGGGVSVVVGEAGTVVYSAEGEPFLSAGQYLTNDLYGVAAGNGIFVAVGSDGAVLRSKDGVRWGQYWEENNETFHSIAFGNGRFVAVREGGVIISSTNGRNWEIVRTSPGTSLSEIEFGNGHFLVLEQGFNRAYLSPDGLNWTLINLPGLARRAEASGGKLWLAGRNYLSRGSLFLRLNGTLNEDGVFTVNFNVPVPGDYALVGATSLPAASWETLATFTNLVSAGSWTETNRLPGARFYGVRPLSLAGLPVNPSTNE